MAVVPSFALGLRAKIQTSAVRDSAPVRLHDRSQRASRQLHELLEGDVPPQITSLPNLSTLSVRYIAAAYWWYLECGRPRVVRPELFARGSSQINDFSTRILNRREPTDADLYQLITYAELIVKIMSGNGEMVYLPEPEEDDD